jgi:hypothetical protein
MFYDIHKNKMCWRVAFKHFRQCLNINDYFLMFLIVCLGLIALVLNWKNEIDGNTAYLVKSNQYIASQYTFARADATKAWRLTASLMNGAIIVNGRLKTVCVITASGDCE